MDYVPERAGVWEINDWSPDGKKLLLWHKLKDVPSENAITPVGELVEYNLGQAIASRKERLPPKRQRGDKWAATLDRFLKTIVLGTPSLAPQRACDSPDGKHIAIVYLNSAKAGLAVEAPGIHKWHSHGKLAICDVMSGAIRTIADPPEGIFTGPICWSPDGKEILVSRNLPVDDDREKSEGSPSFGIWAISLDGKQERFITTGCGSLGLFSRTSPDRSLSASLIDRTSSRRIPVNSCNRISISDDNTLTAWKLMP